MANSLTNIWIRLITPIFPKLAYSIMKRQLLAPETNAGQWPDQIKKVIIRTDYGKVQTYRYGRGKCIWLIHGWADAHQFWPLMRKLAKLGYSCIAIELPPHNSMSNDFISVPKWIRAFETASSNISSPVHIVTHGLGATVLGKSNFFKNYVGDVTLISPIIDYQTNLESVVRSRKLPNKLFKKLLQEFLITDKVKLKDLNATSSIDAFEGRLSVFYSKFDGSSCLRSISKLTRSDNRKIAHFKGATTDRILNSRSLISAIKEENSRLDIAV